MDLTRQGVSKVPQITAFFWVIKLLTTAMGEATSDFLVHHMDPVVVGGIAGLALAGALALQFWARKYVAWIYWLTVAMVAVFGTVAADGLHIKGHVPYAKSTVFFAVVLGIVFFAWYRKERTLSIHSITTPRREVFYWATVLATFALGTAAGDMTASTVGLGYFTSAVLFAGVIVLPAVGYWKFHLNEIVAFWTAYVLTRPVGASLADYLGKPKNLSGVALGDGVVALGLTILIVGMVGYLTVSRIDVGPDQDPALAA